MDDLVYQGERTNVVEHLAEHGWTVTEQTSRRSARGQRIRVLPDNDSDGSRSGS